MFAATLAGMWLAQAAPSVPVAWPVTPGVREWNLAGAFRLKHEKFLRWVPVHDPLRGWQVELRPTWLLELSPTHPRLARFSLAVESSPAGADGGVGMLRPRVQYQFARSQTRIGVEFPIATLVNTASRIGLRALRPMFFVSGRF